MHPAILASVLTALGLGAVTPVRAAAPGPPSSQPPIIAGSGSGAGGGMSGSNSAIGAASGGDGQSRLLAATKSMSETQMSFNLQHLKVQGPTPPQPPTKPVVAKPANGR
ncbi:MAG TPA: hypothetical protein VG960_07065 [Caulobacteraceae bacterium]|nr:hypothetical protein [Caulobacteraceae bacterium]